MREVKPENLIKKIVLVDQDDQEIELISQSQAERLISCGRGVPLFVSTNPVYFKLNTTKDKWIKNRSFRIDKEQFKEHGALHALKSDPYHNISVQLPNGNLIFHCGHKKALWYMVRELVDIISIEPPVLRLKFDPKGEGHLGDKFYLTPKINRCVVCGTGSLLSRHHVLPYQFRRELPEKYKEHNYHDIVVLCLSCHSKYEIEADKLRDVLAIEFNVSTKDSRMNHNREAQKAISAARALLHYSEVIPEYRRQYLSEIIEKYTEQPVTEENLNFVAVQSPYTLKPDYETYGKYIIDRVDLQEFVERWRTHFIEIMKPAFLPEHWDVFRPVFRGK